MPLSWAWARQRKQGRWVGGNRSPRCPHLPPTLGLMCSRKIPGSFLLLGKWNRALKALQECPSKEPCGAVFCKLNSPFIK